MREYDPAELRALQLCELEILRDFIAVCERNDIQYFGVAGTGIGALRHGGFIPWDDDIDVCVLYRDYPRLMRLIEEEFPDKYEVVNAEKYRDCPILNTHIVMKGTRFVEPGFGKLDFPQGVFLDVFPLFTVPADEKKRRRQSSKAWFYGKLLILRHMAFPRLPFKGAKAKLAHCVTAAAHVFVSVFWTHKRLYNKIMRICTKHEGEKTGVNEWFFDTKKHAGVYTDEVIFPLRRIRFEDVDMCFPNKLEQRLTEVFGDYMKLPPPEKRHNHCPDELVLPEGFGADEGREAV